MKIHYDDPEFLIFESIYCSGGSNRQHKNEDDKHIENTHKNRPTSGMIWVRLGGILGPCRHGFSAIFENIFFLAMMCNQSCFFEKGVGDLLPI